MDEKIITAYIESFFIEPKMKGYDQIGIRLRRFSENVEEKDEIYYLHAGKKLASLNPRVNCLIQLKGKLKVEKKGNIKYDSDGNMTYECEERKYLLRPSVMKILSTNNNMSLFDYCLLHKKGNYLDSMYYNDHSLSS